MRWTLLIALFTHLFAEETIMQHAPYGSWKSPITAEAIAKGAVRFAEVKLLGDTVYWLETRAEEKGRVALLSWTKDGGEKELLPKNYSVRTRVHEYGGGALLATQNGFYFVNDADQQIYHLSKEGAVRKITHAPKARFTDGAIHPKDGSLYYVQEEHGDEVINSIVKIDPSNGKIETVAIGHDFYSNPRVSPDGKQLCYLSWDHPNMPWDGTELHVLDFPSNVAKVVAGGDAEAIGDPQWSPEGQLHYISDRTNWWNLYRLNEKKSLSPMEAEFLLPQWSFGRSLVGFINDGIACSYVKNGESFFGQITSSGAFETIDLPYTKIESISTYGNKAALIATSVLEGATIVVYDLKHQVLTNIKKARETAIDPGYLSKPQAIEFPTSHGAIAHAFYYPPTNPDYEGMPGEKPPLLIQSHGGPTAHFFPCYTPGILYWTSRGFAVASVNYRGSTGYGRAYRDSLKGTWGVYDVDDCSNAALYCAKQGLADPERLTIEGGSAGGFTTLAVLAFRDVFKAGADHFGVSDLERLALDTHKFESHYLDLLVGIYPEQRDRYLELSPIYSVDKIRCPIIILQGDEDAIVPPSQSEAMFNSLRARNIPTAYLLFQGEQHGFRKAENIRRALEAQLYFFSKVLKFPLGEHIEPVVIENL